MTHSGEGQFVSTLSCCYAVNAFDDESGMRRTIAYGHGFASVGDYVLVVEADDGTAPSPVARRFGCEDGAETLPMTGEQHLCAPVTRVHRVTDFR